MSYADEVVQRLGVGLRARRDELGLTQRAVADAAGISVDTYRRIESGTGNPRLWGIVRVGRALRVDIRQML